MTNEATFCPTCLRRLGEEADAVPRDAPKRGATLQELVERLAQKCAETHPQLFE